MSVAAPEKPRKKPSLCVSASREYRAWLARLAQHARTSMASVVDQAVLRYARDELHFDEPAPPRSGETHR